MLYLRKLKIKPVLPSVVLPRLLVGGKQLTKAKGSFYKSKDCITGLPASLAVKRVSWTLDITYLYSYDPLWILKH